jgi:predicted 3-demethylubiquinone-9 3-methyltransferase (glyoxalase superfamily)
MQKIIPHLWFDKEAKDAANFYVSVFPDSAITSSTVLRNTPSGDCDVVAFDLMGYSFLSISAGPLFTFNPSVSFFVLCKTNDEVDRLWAKLSEGGHVLMELGEYPFSRRYGWTADKYGVTWQVSLDDGHYQYRHRITPTLMYVGNVAGKAEEAMRFYASVLPESKVGDIARYPAGMEPDKEGTVMHGSVTLAGQEFFAMDSAQKHDFTFNEAISLIVNCDSQEEIDRYWYKLSAVPASEQCGWLKDKFGLSWQITPSDLEEMLRSSSQAQVDRVTQAFLPMKKLNMETIRRAYEGSG